jgi:hypothetical protein
MLSSGDATMAPFLRPDHMMIHCTKGFDIKLEPGKTILDKDVILQPSDIYTMSKVIWKKPV